MLKRLGSNRLRGLLGSVLKAGQEDFSKLMRNLFGGWTGRGLGVRESDLEAGPGAV